MALTIAAVKHFNVVRDGVRDSVFNVTCDNSYPSGGYGLAAAALGLKGIYTVMPCSAPGGYLFSYDYTNSKLMARECAAAGSPPAEVGATDLNGLVVRLEVRGW